MTVREQLRWQGKKPKYPRQGSFRRAADVGARLYSAVLKKPMPGGTRAEPAGRAWWLFVTSADFQAPQLQRPAPATMAEPRFFEDVAAPFRANPKALVPAIAQMAKFENDPFVYRPKDRPEEIDWTLGLPELLLYARLVRALGFDDAADDLALLAYRYLKEMLDPYRDNQTAYDDLSRMVQQCVRARPFALLGFSAVQDFAEADITGGSPRSPAFSGAWAALTA